MNGEEEEKESEIQGQRLRDKQKKTDKESRRDGDRDRQRARERRNDKEDRHGETGKGQLGGKNDAISKDRQPCLHHSYNLFVRRSCRIIVNF